MSFLATMAVYLQVAMAVDVPAILLNALREHIQRPVCLQHGIHQ